VLNAKKAVSVFAKDPFRLLFPVGWAFAIWGVSLWITYALSGKKYYPVPLHGDIMIGGFELCFILGFLMTAIPRFTETSIAHALELFCSCLLVLGLFFGAAFDHRIIFLMFAGFSLIFLVVYGARRIVVRKSNPPYTFIFVALGLVFGLVGLGILLWSSISTELPNVFTRLGHRLFYQDMLLCLILGVGGRLIPGIFGWTEIVTTQRNLYEGNHSFLASVPKNIWFAVLGFLVSIPLEFVAEPTYGRTLKSFVITWIAIKYWRVFSLPKKRTPHTICIWLACWFVLSGSGVYAFFLSLDIAALHLIFVGGFSLLTLMVAARVTMAHSAEGLDIEKNKFPYLWIGALIALAAVTRVFALLGGDYYLHLAYAAICFIAALLLWGVVFMPKSCMAFFRPFEK